MEAETSVGQIAQCDNPGQQDSETVTPIRSILKSPVESVVCTSCKNEYKSSQYFINGLCKDCAEEKERQQKQLQEQKEHPERALFWCGVPSKHINSSFENYNDGDEVKKYLIKACRSGQDILLCGKTGCGKTHLAVAMLRTIIKQATKPIEYHNGHRDPFALFITVPELLFEIRQTFNNRDDSETELSIVDKYSDVPLLVLDDLGAEKTTDWAESTLYLIIDRRNRDEMWTIVTSNLTLQEIEQTLGARIASRLSDMKVVNIKLPDYRKKR